MDIQAEDCKVGDFLPREGGKLEYALTPYTELDSPVQTTSHGFIGKWESLLHLSVMLAAWSPWTQVALLHL